MALDIITTATATTFFRNFTVILGATKGGTLTVVRDYEKDFAAAQITTWASGLSNKWDDVNYYTA